MEELKDMNVDLIQNEYAGIEAIQDKTYQQDNKFSEYMRRVRETNTEDANVLDGPIGNQRVNNTSPNKSMMKKPPELEGDVSLKDFEVWKRKFMDYVVLSEMDKCDHDVQVATLRGFLSTEMYNKTKFAMGIEDETALTIEEILEKIKRFIRAKRNIALDRVEFEQVAQREGEEFDDFYVSLQQTAENADLCGGHCEECSKKCWDMRISTKIMSGINDPETKTKLLAIKEEEFSLEKVIDVCRIEETSRKNEKKLSSQHVNVLNKDRAPFRGNARSGKPTQRYGREWSGGESLSNEYDRCNKCSGKHEKGKCKAFSSQCHGCKQIGHFIRCCPKGGRTNEAKRVNATEIDREQEDEMQNGSVHVRNINQVPCTRAPRVVVAISNEHGKKLGNTEALLDTGADVSIGDARFLRNMNIPVKMLKPPFSTAVKGATQNSFSKLGMIPLKIGYGDNVIQDNVIIVKESLAVPLLLRWDVSAKLRNDHGYPAILNQTVLEKGKNGEANVEKLAVNPSEEEIEAVRRKIIQEFHDVFADNDVELKAMDCQPSEIQIVPEANPIRISTARKLAYAFREETKKELDQMVQQGVIKSVGDMATDWCHPMVVVEKPTGGIRICVDLTKLNKYVKRPIHPGPSPQEVVSDIPPRQKYFTTMDALKGYWQIPLAEESQPLTTFITPWGRYMFLRAPMGLSSTGDKYNLLMDAAFDGLANVKKMVDDILAYDEDFSTHVKNVRKLLERCRVHGISISKKKFEFGKTQVKYVGFIVSQEGIKADPDKLKAIGKFPTPTNITELRSFMGLVNQLTGHSQMLVQAALPLRPLLKTKSEFQWMEEHTEAMEAVKKVITSFPIRMHFDPKLPTILETDAARRKGLGYCLMQRHPDGLKLVEAGSRWLTPPE